MTKIERSVVIERPPQAVWDYVHDIRNDPTWQSTVLQSRQLTDGPMSVGTRIAEERRFLDLRFETTYEVTEYQRSRRSAVKTTSGPIPATGSYVVQAADGGTCFTMLLETEAYGFFKLAEPVFARMARREMEPNLGHLKDLLETGSTPSAE